MEDKLVTIAEFPSYIEAEMAQQLLADNGIKAVVLGENAANIYSMPAIEATHLQVFESQAQEAKEILESQQSELEEDEDYEQDYEDDLETYDDYEDDDYDEQEEDDF